VRLLHLADRLTDRGGAYRYLLGVLEAQRAGHEVLLAIGADDGTARAPCRVVTEPALALRGRMEADFDGLVRDFRPDLLHLHNLMNPALLEWASTLDRPALLTVQDHRYFCPARGKWTREGRPCRERFGPGVCAPCFEDEDYFTEVLTLTEQRREAARRLPATVLSSYMKMELEEAGFAARAVRVVRPFVAGLEARPPDGPPCVLVAGRLVLAKGLRDAVRAWRSSGISLPLVVAGTGPLRDELEREPGVEGLGFVPPDRMGAVYARARAVLMPSLWQEPFGLVGLEALHFGVPVVAYDSGGIREWHPGPGLVPWGDVAALSAALASAVHRRARKPAGFEAQAGLQALEDVYRELRASFTP
jgi:glycosyltransferase involved in cell wall biosynthesis